MLHSLTQLNVIKKKKMTDFILNSNGLVVKALGYWTEGCERDDQPDLIIFALFSHMVPII